MLRDFEFWRDPDCDAVEAKRLRELKRQEQLRAERLEKELQPVRVALRVTVWDCKVASGRGSGDLVYWAGLGVSVVQLVIATVPWGVWDEWLTFVITSCGTLLAYASGALPQWVEEKSGVRKLHFDNPATDRKVVLLTEGNGSHDVILISSQHGCLDLEALAGPQRSLQGSRATRVYSAVLAILWIVLLVSIAGWDRHTWFLLVIGLLGLVHNAAVCAIRRRPSAYGIELEYQQTIVAAKVMEVLHDVETKFPQAGAALLDEFFSGDLRPREELLWNFARRRYELWRKGGCLMRGDGVPDAHEMPSLQRPAGAIGDSDIPAL